MKRVAYALAGLVAISGIAFAWMGSRYKLECPRTPTPVACDPSMVPVHPAVADYVGMALLVAGLVAFALLVAGMLFLSDSK